MALTKLNARSATALDATILTGNLPALNGSSLTNISAGKVGQVVSAHRSTVNSFSSSSTSSFADLGISLDITPSATSSKILIMSLVNITQSTSSTIHVQLLRDSTVINISTDKKSSQVEDMNNIRFQSATPYGNALYHAPQHFLDSPNTTSQITYKLRGTLGASYSGTYWVNRSNDDNDADYSSRNPSNLTALEILA